MLAKLREILLTQYIGSILVALLVWQAVVEIVSTIVRSGFWYFNQRHSQSVLAPSETPYPWDRFIFAAVTVGLYLVTSYSLARWLYPAIAPAVTETPTETPEESPSQSDAP
jgi:hypothetical protein